MKALIDADNIAFACAASAENDPVFAACARADDMISGILHDLEIEECELWFTGDGNFRYSIYPEYKANRVGGYRPKWEKDVKQYLTDKWNANWTSGIEGDDMLGIRQFEVGENNSIICHLDKDINQIPGWHYNWELRRLGKVVREKQKYFVEPEVADRFFFYQLLTGDPTDNIKGAAGIGPKKANTILDQNPPSEWLNVIKEYFSSEEELDMNATCIYILRKHNDSWRNVIEKYLQA